MTARLPFVLAWAAGLAVEIWLRDWGPAAFFATLAVVETWCWWRGRE